MPLGSPRERPASYAAVALEFAGAGLILVGAFVPWVRSHAFFPTNMVLGFFVGAKSHAFPAAAERLVLANAHDADIQRFGVPLQFDLPPIQMIQVQSGG